MVLGPEDRARLDIDELLTKAGWVIQNQEEIHLGVAVRELRLTIGASSLPLITLPCYN